MKASEYQLRATLVSLAMFVGIVAPTASSYAQTYQAPDNSKTELNWLNGRNVDSEWEAYRAKFDECDQKNTFGGKNVGNRTCFRDSNGNHRFDPNEVNDHNNVKYLFPLGGASRAVLFQSKLSLDVDGGYRPCILKSEGTDQCATSMDFDPALRRQYQLDKNRFGSDVKIPNDTLKNYFDKLFVQSDIVPFIALPSSDTGEFSTSTSVKTGDVGVVIFNNHVVPVLVADRGPFFRLGEASLQVFDQIGVSKCRKRSSADPKYCEKVSDLSIPSGVTVILVPGSAFPKGHLTPNNVVDQVKDKAGQLYQALKAQ